MPLSELGLRQADELLLGLREPPRIRTGVVELVVAGGPEAGRRIPLATGAHRVGPEAAVALDDPSLSADHLVITVAADGAVSFADAGSRNGTAVEGVALAPGEQRALDEGELVQAGRTLLRVDARDAIEPRAPFADAGGRLLTRLPTMLFFSLLAPVMAVTTYVEDRRGGRKGLERQRLDYRRHIASSGCGPEAPPSAQKLFVSLALR